jgi:hypothetical protein
MAVSTSQNWRGKWRLPRPAIPAAETTVTNSAVSSGQRAVPVGTVERPGHSGNVKTFQPNGSGGVLLAVPTTISMSRKSLAVWQECGAAGALHSLTSPTTALRFLFVFFLALFAVALPTNGAPRLISSAGWPRIYSAFTR